uniref:Uncharacterized protein n=1 Tax=Arundo donax TaxID=35708 RepID=A0A0A9G5U2_ARUDO
MQSALMEENLGCIGLALLSDSEKSCNFSKITVTKTTLGLTTIHTSIFDFIHEDGEPKTAIILCSGTESRPT